MKLLKNFQQPLPRNELKNILGGGMAFSAGRGTCISTYSCLTQFDCHGRMGQCFVWECKFSYCIGYDHFGGPDTLDIKIPVKK